MRLGRIEMNQEISAKKIPSAPTSEAVTELYYNKDGTLVVGEYRYLDPPKRHALKTDYDWLKGG